MLSTGCECDPRQHPFATGVASVVVAALMLLIVTATLRM